MVDLGTLPGYGGSSSAVALNEAGVKVGEPRLPLIPPSEASQAAIRGVLKEAAPTLELLATASPPGHRSRDDIEQLHL